MAFTVLVATVFGAFCVVGLFSSMARGPSVENFEQRSAAFERSTKSSREGTPQTSDGKLVDGQHHGMFEDDDAVKDKVPEFMRDYFKFHNEQVAYIAAHGALPE